ncbi:putative bifunctional diguanylate cyclase/phosphodiesterase [Sulfurimonas sp.]|uniref:putative bifunctional diguanylate cyclase/phosphodiesterase n=1 Tax=Sulfurimonas sp. TaxID=2022749 RepID=UPI00356B531C
MSKNTSFTKITAKIIFFTLVVTIAISYSYAEYMKKKAISEVAHIDAKKTSSLVFESLYSAMQRGWTKEDLKEIINRLNRVDENMRINVYRSPLVAELYGEIENDKQIRENNMDVKKAMSGIETLDISEESNIKYFYPVSAKNACLKCHTNANVGDTLGVINVSYPIKELKVSLNYMVNFFILFMTIFSLVVFLAIFIELEKYIIKPIKNFSSVIKNITTSHDMRQRINIDEEIEEIDSIKDVFNSMLDSIEYQFYNDPLTGLKNRRRIIELLDKEQPAILMIINIDSFQEINDLYGDDSGDTLLIEFSNYLKEIIPDNDSLYRLHSDEFAYVCESHIDINEFTHFVDELIEKILHKTFIINSTNEINISATIGISHGTHMLLPNADTAMLLAKKEKKNYLIYDDSMAMSKIYEKNFLWSKRLKKAIDEDKIVPLFQPIIDCKTQKIVKYESLVRIKNDDGTYIPPIHFLELAKKNKIYHKLTKIMLDKTIDIFKDSNKQVSINLSVEDILNEETNSYIMKKLQESNISNNIVFEIIESEGIENFDEVFKFINDVKRFGTKISIDDFGTGYSNFEYLMKLKVDYIKIDGSMVKNIDVDKNSITITQTIIEFAKKMNIETVAEFVCSKDVYDKVSELGVDYVQGYYFGKPKEEIEA